jgi:hypothetical protein
VPAMGLLDLCLIGAHAQPGEPPVRLGVPLLDEYLGVPGRGLPAEHGARVGLRPEGVLHRGWQGTSRRAAGRRVRAGDRPTGRTTVGRRGGTAGRRRRSRWVPAHRASPVVQRVWAVAFLHARGEVPTNPVPRGLPTRRERQRPHHGVPIVRGVRRLPRILAPAEVDALTGAVRTHRDRAMVAAMVLGGLRRCEVLGLRLEDLRVAERRVFIAEGRGRAPAAGAAVAPFLRPRRGLSGERASAAMMAVARFRSPPLRGVDKGVSAAASTSVFSRQ